VRYFGRLHTNLLVRPLGRSLSPVVFSVIAAASSHSSLPSSCSPFLLTPNYRTGHSSRVLWFCTPIRHPVYQTGSSKPIVTDWRCRRNTFSVSRDVLAVITGLLDHLIRLCTEFTVGIINNSEW